MYKFKDHMIAMAHSEFIFKPLCLLTWMKDGINGNRLKKFKIVQLRNQSKSTSMVALA